MGSIKHLPEGVHSYLRSSVLLFDVTRVIEELVYNSVDAGSTKVHVFINVGTCCVRVEDDGYGISRDGLVLLGERYATPKLHSLVEEEADIESLASRGETLGSLSDISLLEVITKARGRPNGYCKVIKGCKSLYLGINDHRKDIGTTVIVRDLFYNQPVRRKCMQSSPKKVLQMVKNCVFRIALVFPQIVFRVTDTESQDELLCTLPSITSLPLVTSGFGSEVSRSLDELHFSEGFLKLSGYFSSPGCSFSTKAFQYIYVNSRFICKNSIHKLLNALVTKSKCYFTSNEDDHEFHKLKKHKTQESPAYLLNLCCPQSLYDLTFEPSKTVVEFKDWPPVLSFIEKAVRHFWENAPAPNLQGTCDHVPDENNERKKGKERQNTRSKEFFTEELPEALGTSMQKNLIEHHMASIPDTSWDDTPDFRIEDFCFKECRDNFRKSSRQLLRNAGGLKRCRQGTEYSDQTNFNSCGRVSAETAIGVTGSCYPSSSINQMALGIEFYPICDSYLLKEIGERHITIDTEVEDLHLRCRNSFLEFDNLSPEPSRDCSFNYRSSSGLRRSLFNSSYEQSTICNDLREGSEWVNLKSPIDLVDKGCNCKTFSYFPTALQKDSEASQSASPLLKRCGLSLNSDFLCRDFEASKAGGSDLSYSPLSKIGKHCLFQSTHAERCYGSALSIDSDYWKDDKKILKIDCNYFMEGETEDEFWNHCSENNKCISERNLRKFAKNGHYLDATVSALDGSLCVVNNGRNWLNSNLTEFDHDNELMPRSPVFSSDRKVMVDDSWTYEPEWKNCDQYLARKVHRKRSSSAPPFHKERRKFSVLGSMLPEKETHRDTFLQSRSYLPAANINAEAPSAMELVVDGSDTCSKTDREHVTGNNNRISEDGGRFDKSSFAQLTTSIDEFNEDDVGDVNIVLSKWRNRGLQPRVRENSQKWPEHNNDILDIYSGLLQHCGGSLVPEFISKDFLDRVTVLQQLDKKFIPVISDATFAIIDQHAADERIRLEELHQKVLSGEGKTVAYLDSEEELVLPEFGFQLLQNYAEQIENWGWVCKIHTEETGSFTKSLGFLHKQSFKITLAAVPRILGVNLSDKDLMDFLDQLAETDGSSTVPPAVHRILNYKACRGAIMFGDSLLPSECSLIVEELKNTSLCFQCAHGRPTTVPIVNLEALHKQLAKLGQQNGSKKREWHGLEHHKPTLERTKLRLVEDGGG